MDPFLIVLFLVLFSLSAFFSGTELALMSLPEHKIEALYKEGKFGAKALKKIKQNNDRLLIMILIGNNLVNVYTAALATSIAISLASAAGIAQSSAIGIATGVVTLLLLLFGEIIPKSIATKNAAKVSLIVAPIYKILIFLFYPAIIVIEKIIKLFTPKDTSSKITDEEIESFLEMGRDSGSLEQKEHEKIKNILDFDETTVEEIMTPRVKIEALSSDTTVKQALKFYLNHTHSRIPVYEETIDKINYFLTPRDLLRELKDGNLDKKISKLKIQKVMKIPLNQPISTLFEKFQKSHKVMAIAIDEYGGVSGLVTIEDVVEEVFGEIRDESDKEVDEIKKVGNNCFLVEPDVLIEDMLENFGLKLPNIGLDEKEFDGETLSYVITHLVEGFPYSGEVIKLKIRKKKDFKFSFLQLKVLEMIDHKIGKVEVKGIKEKHSNKK